MTGSMSINPHYATVIDAIFEADHAKDADRFVRVLCEDASMRIGGGEALVGRAAIHDAVVGLFSQFSGITHRLVRAYDFAPKLIYEAEVTYELSDGDSMIFPYANILTFNGNLISDYRIYIDLSPLQSDAKR